MESPVAGVSLDNPLPVIPGYDPARDTWASDGKVKFESTRMARCEEDPLRRHLLLEAVRRYPDLIDTEAALDLAIRLERDPKDRSPPQTLASSEHYRAIRRGLASQVWNLLATSGLGKGYAISLRPSGLFVPARDLTVRKMKSIGRQFKTEFDREGITKTDGFLVMGLHGEFDVNREGYDVHLHLGGAGEKVDALEALRRVDRYEWTYRGLLPDGRKQSSRVVVSELKREHYPNRLTYISQAYWPHSPTGRFGGSDEMLRGHRAGRMPEPYHANWLLLMDSLRVSDLVFTSGLKLTRNGFVLV